MAFRRKWSALAPYQPDIVVVQECESPDVISRKSADLPFANRVWAGENPFKGLGVFSTEQIQLRIPRWHDPSIRYVLPVEITCQTTRRLLFAVWTQAGETQTKSYVHYGLQMAAQYGHRMKRSTILTGDFNSSPVFRTNGKRHVELTEKLAARGMVSAYHQLNGVPHGAEPQATFWLHRNIDKPYHLDYVFTHRSATPKSLKIGDPNAWLTLSDHAPLIADF